jgi:hypothetical protein
VHLPGDSRNWGAKGDDAMRIQGAALIAAFITLLPVGAEAASCSNSVFCGGWLSVCNRRSPPSAAAECRQRYTACLSSGCFHFNVPRARCKSNAEDMALTTACQRAR